MLHLFALIVAPSLALPCAARLEGGQILPAEPIRFVEGSYDLGPTSSGPIEGVACLLQAQPELVLQIEVHTDLRGPSPHSLHFSSVRAVAISQALIDQGVSYERLTAVGRGESMPVEHQDPATRQLLSRRIELWIDPGSRPPAPTEEGPPEPEDLHIPSTGPSE